MKRTIILLSKLLRRPEVWAAAALVTVSACGKLDVQNPNRRDVGEDAGFLCVLCGYEILANISA